MQNHNKEKPRERAGYKIWQIDPNTKDKIKLFENATRAAEFMNIEREKIGKAARSNNICCGFYWEFDKIDEDKDEIWIKMIKNTREFYVSNKGRIKDEINRLITLNINTDGYVKCICIKKPYSVHRLVAEAFLPNTNNLPIVNHKDSNKQNNCVDNLEWATASDNSKHAWASGSYDESDLMKKVYEIDLITGNVLNEYKSVTELAKILKVERSTLSDRIRNRRFKSGIAYSFEPTYILKKIRKISCSKIGELLKEYPTMLTTSINEKIPRKTLTRYIKLKINHNGFLYSHE